MNVSMSANTIDVNENSAFLNVEFTVETKQMLGTLMELGTKNVTFEPDFNKSIPVFYGLNFKFQALDWLNIVNSIAT